MIKTIVKPVLRRMHDLLFNTVHSRILIYNTCWEDPRIDRQLLALDETSHVVMITSAGCNALDYALDKPAQIHAVDINPRQNALLELKLALIQEADHEALWQMLGRGSHQQFVRIYSKVRLRLSAPALAFWDKQIRYFDNNNRRKTFYYHGGAGAVAWGITRLLFRHHGLQQSLQDLWAAQSLDEQRQIYQRIEPALWGRFISWLISHPVTLSLVGVPHTQLRLIRKQYPGGLLQYVQDKMRHVFTNVPINDNYFWHVYLTGSYTKYCCPNYLKAEHFSALHENTMNMRLHNTTISEFLRNNPGAYSHFVLLDHQDWLVRQNPQALEEEWQLILKNSQPGTKILMRSASQELDFLPQHISEKLRFHSAQTQALHLQDRVGTYASVHLAEVR